MLCFNFLLKSIHHIFKRGHHYIPYSPKEDNKKRFQQLHANKFDNTDEADSRTVKLSREENTTLIPLSRKENSDARNSRKAKTMSQKGSAAKKLQRTYMGTCAALHSGRRWPHSLISITKTDQAKMYLREMIA